MLEQMRKHMNWIMWTILVLVIVSFLFFGIFPSGSGQGVAASVNGDVITSSELNREYQNTLETYRQIFKDQFNDAMAKTLRSQTLRELIQNRLLVQEAKRIGLKASDEEVRATIMNIPSFQQDGRFNPAAYQRYLDYVNQKPAAFEAVQRNIILREKLVRLIEDSVAVTDEEVSAGYAARNAKLKKGAINQDKASFRRSLLDEKKQAALEAFVQGLYKKAEVKTNASEVAL
jgi:peptidyl-prolyl cis-trans isomerase D